MAMAAEVTLDHISRPSKIGADTDPLILVELGKAIQDRFSAVGRQDKENATARVVSLEHIARDYLVSCPPARKVITFTDAKPRPWPKIEEARILGFIAYCQLCNNSGPPPITWLAQVVANGDVRRSVDIRRRCHDLCRRGILVYSEGQTFCNGTLALGKAAVGFILSSVSPSPLFTVHSLPASRQNVGNANNDLGPAEGGKASGCSVRKGIPTPKMLAGLISQHVIGLDPVVRTLSCRLVLHMQRAKMLLRKGEDPGTPNECILVLGPSGSGKTFSLETAGRICGLPFGSTSASDLSEEGWVGLSPTDVLKPMLKTARSPEAARCGVIFVDEFDSKRTSSDSTRDISGAGVQKGLLRLVEGTETIVGGRRASSWDKPRWHDTTGNFFAFAGVFDGLSNILDKQVGQAGIGFTMDSGSGGMRRDIRAALETYGVISELSNRLTGILVFPQPTVPQLVRIATVPTGIVASYRRLLCPSGIDLNLTPAAIRIMAEHSQANRTYSRGMKSVMSRLVEEIVYEGKKGNVKLGVSEMKAALGAMDTAEAM